MTCKHGLTQVTCSSCNHPRPTYRAGNAYGRECDLCGDWIYASDRAGWHLGRPVHEYCLTDRGSTRFNREYER